MDITKSEVQSLLNAGMGEYKKRGLADYRNVEREQERANFLLHLLGLIEKKVF